MWNAATILKLTIFPEGMAILEEGHGLEGRVDREWDSLTSLHLLPPPRESERRGDILRHLGSVNSLSCCAAASAEKQLRGGAVRQRLACCGSASLKSWGSDFLSWRLTQARCVNLGLSPFWFDFLKIIVKWLFFPPKKTRFALHKVSWCVLYIWLTLCSHKRLRSQSNYALLHDSDIQLE